MKTLSSQELEVVIGGVGEMISAIGGAAGGFGGLVGGVGSLIGALGQNKLARAQARQVDTQTAMMRSGGGGGGDGGAAAAGGGGAPAGGGAAASGQQIAQGMSPQLGPSLGDGGSRISTSIVIYG